MAVAAAVAAVPAAAQAHVTVQPKSVVAGGYTRLDVRVPTERDDASTTKIALQLPHGFTSAAYEPVAGWKVKLTKVKLAKPIKTGDGEVTSEVREITWTADSTRDGIPPNAFRDFGLSVAIPGKPGDTLTFKAVQTYSSGEVVRWIGPEGSDEPAPTVSLTAADGAGSSSAATPTPTPPTATATATAAAAAPASAKADDGSSKTLAVIALIVGALGLLVGIAGFASGRKARESVRA